MAKVAGSESRSRTAWKAKQRKGASMAGMASRGMASMAEPWTWWRRGDVRGMEEKNGRLAGK